MKLFRRRQPAASAPIDEAATFDGCETTADVLERLRSRAAALASADSVIIAGRDGDEIVCIATDPESPVRLGDRFKMAASISGQAIREGHPIAVDDILDNKRVPLNAYIATYMRSMLVVPIGRVEPRFAMTIFWRDPHLATIDAEPLMCLGDAAAALLNRGGGGQS